MAVVPEGDLDPGFICKINKDALARCRRERGSDDPRTLGAANGLAAALLADTKWEAARDLARDTLRRGQRAVGLDQTVTDASADLLAKADAGYEEAMLSLNGQLMVYRLSRASRGDGDAVTVVAAFELVRMMVEIGEASAAFIYSHRNLKQTRRAFGEDEIITLDAAASHITVLSGISRHSSARRLAEETLARGNRVLGVDEPATLVYAYLLAAELRALGDHGAARALDSDTLDRRRRVLEPGDPDIRKSERALATDLHLLGQSPNP